ncbi:pyruvate dehydrogenase (acetyl-transferring), homodimeric type, partial [Galactobacter valiniphilus]
GAGWNVIKVVWGREWDSLLAKDDEGALVDIMNSTPDGDYQTYKAESGAFVREHFFGKDPRTKDMVADLSDDEIWNLKRGGHDYRKVYAAYKAATEHQGQPTVILAHTVKGYGLGTHFEGRNATHQMKKLTLDDLKAFRDHLRIPITGEQLEKDPYRPPYYHPGMDAPEIQYLMTRRHALGGFTPERRTRHTELALPGDKAYTAATRGSGTQQAATTMAFVRLLKDLMRDKQFGQRIVPIVPDESRTFGMDSLFPTAKIYNPNGQNYISVDRELVLAYKESAQGQLIHPGINEAGAVAAFTAAGTSYSTHGEPLIPVYVVYSMFGFQRTADAFWAAGDQMARDFVIGATAGRTTLTGEGLQHADGHSHLLAATNPAVVSYDPAYGYEIGHIMRSGLERMYGGKHADPDVMYYVTVYNEPYVQPAEPADVDVEGIIKGIHRVSPAAAAAADAPKAQLLASGVAVPWTIEAQRLLAEDWGVAADVWSVTSWNELARDGHAADAATFEDGEDREAYVTSKLAGAEGPVVAVSDHMKAVPEQLRPFIPGDYSVLGADGFGFSDTRAAARRFFRIDAHSVVVKALQRLEKQGQVPAGTWREAYNKYRIDVVTAGIPGNAGGDA